jgi:aryl-alcohol dehydrogenase-like predicted oxidoreductase
MGMSDFYGAAVDAKSIEVIHRAPGLGIDFFDTSDMYGPASTVSQRRMRLLERDTPSGQ